MFLYIAVTFFTNKLFNYKFEVFGLKPIFKKKFNIFIIILVLKLIY